MNSINSESSFDVTMNNSLLSDEYILTSEAQNKLKNIKPTSASSNECISNNKPEKRPLLERQLEINMLTRPENSSPESPNKSRYGRARRQNTRLDCFYTSNIPRSPSKSPKKFISKSPNQSPVAKISPVKNPSNVVSSFVSSPELANGLSPGKKISNGWSECDSQSSVEIETELAPWKDQIHSKPLKVYVRKDLIQKKKESVGKPSSPISSIFACTDSFMNTSKEDSIFAGTLSPGTLNLQSEQTDVKSPTKCISKKSLSLKKDNKCEPLQNSFSIITPLKTSPIQDSKYALTSDTNVPQSSASNSKDVSEIAISKDIVTPKKRKYEKKIKGAQTNNRQKPVVEIEKSNDLNIIGSSGDLIEQNDLIFDDQQSMKIIEDQIEEDEKNCMWKLGEILWARVGSHPYWPCLITKDPFSQRFVRKKKVGKSLQPVEVYHVTFFGDSGRHSWLLAKCLMKFEGLELFNKTRDSFTPEIRKKDPKYCAAFEIRESKRVKWLTGAQEAEMLMRRPLELRDQFFFDMLTESQKTAGKEKKNKKPKSGKKNLEVSLSESLFDGLFNNSDDSKTDLNSSVGTSLVLKNAVDNCINTLAATTGNEKIKVQTHMDRWLLKAKNPKLASTSQKLEEIANEKCAKTVVDIDLKTVPKVSVSVSNIKTPISRRRFSVANFPNTSILIDENKEKNRTLRRRQSIAKFDSHIVDSGSNDDCSLRNRNVVHTFLPEKSRDLIDSLEEKAKNLDANLGSQINMISDSSNSETPTVTPKNNKDSNIQSCNKVLTIKRRKSIAVLPFGLKNADIGEGQSTDDYKGKIQADSRRATLRRRKTIDCREINVLNKKNEGDLIASSDAKLGSDQTEVNVKIDDIKPIEATAPKENDDSADVLQEHEEKKSKGSKYEDPDFLEFLELKRDELLEENPDLTEECMKAYLFKTWQYGESKKTDDMKNAEDYCLVKGMGEESVTTQVKRKREKRPKDMFDLESVDAPRSPDANRDKSLRKKTIKCYFTKDSDESDIEDNDSFIKDPSMENVAPKGQNGGVDEKNVRPICDSKSNKKEILEKTIEIEQEEIIENPVDYYMESMKEVKPDIFKGLVKEKVCDICEKTSNLTKCKGPCGGMYHIDCVQKQNEPATEESKKGRRKKKGGRKRKSDTGESGVNTSYDTTLDESQLDNEVTGAGDKVLPMSIVTDAHHFESQSQIKLQEMLEQSAVDFDISSTSMDLDNEWNGVKAGDCIIVDITEQQSKSKETVQTICSEADLFKCNNCLKHQIPLCFICKSTVCTKNGSEKRQKCSVPHCNKYYHNECLQIWPQTKFSSSCSTKYQKKTEVVESFSCPRHVCHTCVCDDPRGSNTRFSADKLVRCTRCPATYHCFTKCVPAGTRLLTASQLICSRHNDVKSTKKPVHVNNSWCCICSKGGSLICCESCPMSMHAECLKISPPEGGYICEDCETGRLPLYEEVVWAKLGHYRWWPALVLHPADVPPNIMALSHGSNQFVVRFFGDYGHSWVNSKRVYPYLEGDTGHASSRKSSVDTAFLTAIKQAQQAHTIIKEKKQVEEDDFSHSLLPPQYVKLKVNRPVGSALNYKNNKVSTQKCECDPNSENPCGPDSYCINRMLMTECSPTVCAARERCCNQAFEKRQYPPLAPSKTQHRGWGLKALADVKKGDFVIEYVGEIIDEAEFQRRMARKRETRDQNYYFLTLDKDRMIDAGPKGNVARFMNHCCEPNCETQKWTVNGDIRVGLFAIEDIPAGTEVTFNYNLLCADDDKKKCMCGAKRCAGFIGAKLKQEEVIPKIPKKSAIKRKYNKKPVNSSAVKPVKARRSSMYNQKKKGSLSNPIEENGIEKDWMEISKATSTADDKEANGYVDQPNKSNLIDDCSYLGLLTSSKLGESNKDEICFDSKNTNMRKRKYSLDLGTSKKNKRARSNSVYFSENLLYVEPNGEVVNVFPMPNKSFDGDFAFLDDAEQNKAVKAKRGRPKKAIVVNEI